jgi:hypothetical protein
MHVYFFAFTSLCFCTTQWANSKHHAVLNVIQHAQKYVELKIYYVKQDVTLITYPSLSSIDDSTQSPYQKGFPIFSVLPQKYHLYHIYYFGNLFNIFSFKQSLNLILCLPSGPLAIYFQWNTFLAQEIPYHACFS